MKVYKSCHKENTTTRIRLDELGVQDTDSCITDFDCDPFNPANVQLRSLQSGQLVSEEVKDDLLSAFDDGEKKVREFFDKRIFSRIKDWAISKSHQKTCLTVNRKATSFAKCNTIEMENNTMSRVISQYCGTDITLDGILKNRVTNESLSLFNLNVTMAKTQKSKLLHTFTFVPLDSFDMQDYTAVVDMRFFWRLCMPSIEDKEKGDETKYTWSDYASKIFFTVMNLHSNTKAVIFVNDRYDVTDSFKKEEHLRRNCMNWSKNIYMKSNGELPNKISLLTFFTNKSNKIRLQNFLKTKFQKLFTIIPKKRAYLFSAKEL